MVLPTVVMISFLFMPNVVGGVDVVGTYDGPEDVALQWCHSELQRMDRHPNTFLQCYVVKPLILP